MDLRVSNRTIPTGAAAAFQRGRTYLFLVLLLWSGVGAGATVPDIEVRDSGGANLLDGASVSFGDVSVNGSATKTFTIRNNGSCVLFDLAITKSGAHTADFNDSGLTSVLFPLGSSSFSITFSPSQIGSRAAILHIQSNDPDEDPFDINVYGRGTAPEIAVSHGASNLTDGASVVNFGNVDAGLTVKRILTIRNNGTGPLTGLSVNLSGSAAFTGGMLSVTTLASSAYTSIDVFFKPADAAASSGLLQIFSNDTDENPFDIELRGTGVVPLMEVEQPAGTGLTDAFSTVDFGSTPPGTSASLTFTLRNASTGPLTGLTLSKDGGNAADFTLEPLASTSLGPGNTTTFAVTFTPAAPGVRTAAIHVVSNESAANPFDINVTGTGGALSDLGDADGDGTVNLIEEATAGDPLTRGPPPGLLSRNGGMLEFTFTRRVAVLPELTITVEWGDNLTDWNSMPEEAAIVLSDDGTVQMVKYTVPAAPDGSRFLRVRVTRP